MVLSQQVGECLIGKLLKLLPLSRESSSIAC